MRGNWSRPIAILLFAGFALCATAGSAAAQTRADTAAVLLQAARDLEAGGDGDAARAVLDLIRRRYADTPAAASAAPLLQRYVNQAQPDGSGRVELLVWGTTYGIWAGVTTPVLLGSEDAAAYGAGLLAGAPLGFLAARSYVNAHPNISSGQARAITFGGTWGSWQGFGWTQVLGDHRTDCNGDVCYEYDTGPSAETTLAAMLAGGVAGIGTGAILARKPIPSGVAAMVGSSSLWGSWFGLASAVLVDGTDNNLLASTLIGGDAAVVAAGILAPKWKPSVNRVRLVSLAGLVGGVAGGGLILILQPESENLAIGIPLATSIGGLLAGAHLTRDYDRERRAEPQGGEGFLRLSDGDWQLGEVLPRPTLRRFDAPNGKRVLEPAVSLTLFHASF
jgi:hypothetical protein